MIGKLSGGVPEGDLSSYLSGEKLYGDDFSLDEIGAWFSSEEEGYANLGSRDRKSYEYSYHELNKFHGFRFIRKARLKSVLGVGSAYGDEFGPITGRVDSITILDPSDAFVGIKTIGEVPCSQVKPSISGDMPFESGSFDLITCFGVLHHIPNVSHVVRECFRCLSVDGLLIVREPVVSMGDWRMPRAGLTKNERGIPLHVFESIFSSCGFRVKNRSLCDFTPITVVARKVGFPPFNFISVVMIDALLSRWFEWNWKYHRTRFFDRLAPASVAYVLSKS